MLTPAEGMWIGHLVSIEAVQHRMELENFENLNCRRIHLASYRAAQMAREFEEQEIDRVLAMYAIRPALTEWTSLRVFAPKKDCTPHICVDYRKLNTVTITDSYPIQCMDECIDLISDATIFSALNANSGYWQVEVEVSEDDRYSTALTSHNGLFCCTRINLRLKIAPLTFQRAMEVLLTKVKRKFALVYLDDIMIF